MVNLEYATAVSEHAPDQPDLMYGNGCSIYGDCFTCPLSVCRYDRGGQKAKAVWLRRMSDGYATLIHTKAAQRWASDAREVRHRYLRGMPVTEIAAAMALKQRRVAYIINHEGMTQQMVELQRRRVVRLRAKGVTWEGIADRLGLEVKACRARFYGLVWRATVTARARKGRVGKGTTNGVATIDKEDTVTTQPTDKRIFVVTAEVTTYVVVTGEDNVEWAAGEAAREELRVSGFDYVVYSEFDPNGPSLNPEWRDAIPHGAADDRTLGSLVEEAQKRVEATRHREAVAEAQMSFLHDNMDFPPAPGGSTGTDY